MRRTKVFPDIRKLITKKVTTLDTNGNITKTTEQNVIR